ncbi:MAG: hypothetical protein Q7J31_07830 [Syntrophales bacterium]|nr:hypothetical protein [Syntrophales bacterium]
MKSFREELWFNIPSRRGFVNITSQVEQCLKVTEEIRNQILKNKSQALAVERKIAGFIKIDINQTIREITVC